MKYVGENSIKKLIALIKGDLSTKQPTITAEGILKGDGEGTITAAETQEATLVDVPTGLLKGDGTTITAAVGGTDYVEPENIKDVDLVDVVSYSPETRTDAEKAQARANIGAAPESHVSDTTVHVTAAEKEAWNGKQDALSAATEAPVMDGTAAVGTSAKYAREDHVHPSDTSKLSLTGGTMTGRVEYANKSFQLGKFLGIKNDQTGPYYGISGYFRDDSIKNGSTEEADSRGNAGVFIRGAAMEIGTLMDGSGNFYSGGTVGIHSLSDPTNTYDAANKNYVDTTITTKVPEWARSATKPTYTATDVGAISIIYELSQIGLTTDTMTSIQNIVEKMPTPSIGIFATVPAWKTAGLVDLGNYGTLVIHKKTNSYAFCQFSISDTADYAIGYVNTGSGTGIKWSGWKKVVTTVDTALSSTSTNPVQNKVINTAIAGKQATITGGATTIANSNLTASRALVSDANGKVAVSAVTSTELGYLDGVTSAIQTQINGKAASSHNHAASNITSGTLALARGGTGKTAYASTNYTTIEYRGERFATADTNPGTNGTICWTYG